jgi:hypothetical protein
MRHHHAKAITNALDRSADDDKKHFSRTAWAAVFGCEH